MRPNRGPQIVPSVTYIAKATTLSAGEIEQLGQRMQGRFCRRREDVNLSDVEILALQLEFEDKQLNAWRSSVSKIRKNTWSLTQSSAGIS